MLAIGKEDAKYFNWLVHLGYICKSIVTNQVYVGNLHKLCVIYGSYLLSLISYRTHGIKNVTSFCVCGSAS